jgi:serine protease Do
MLTAGHVSGYPNQDVTIILADGRRLKGRTLGANFGIDSGLVRITERADFDCVEMAKSSAVTKGQWCLTLGHPNGYKPGRPPVVRLGRLQGVHVNALISDCALVGGDSGGPLFDMHGRVIGIHSRIGDKVSSNIHVPVDTYRDTWTRLAASQIWGDPIALPKFAKPSEAYFGVRASPTKAALKIDAVTVGSPADQAGLRTNDVILKIDDTKFGSVSELGAFLRGRRPGHQIQVHVQRGSETLAIAVVLGKRAS